MEPFSRKNWSEESQQVSPICSQNELQMEAACLVKPKVLLRCDRCGAKAFNQVPAWANALRLGIWFAAAAVLGPVFGIASVAGYAGLVIAAFAVLFAIDMAVVYTMHRLTTRQNIVS